jgi:hypothetical protein
MNRLSVAAILLRPSAVLGGRNISAWHILGDLMNNPPMLQLGDKAAGDEKIWAERAF